MAVTPGVALPGPGYPSYPEGSPARRLSDGFVRLVGAAFCVGGLSLAGRFLAP